MATSLSVRPIIDRSTRSAEGCGSDHRTREQRGTVVAHDDEQLDEPRAGRACTSRHCPVAGASLKVVHSRAECAHARSDLTYREEIFELVLGDGHPIVGVLE